MICEEIYKRIRQVRLEKGLSQKTLGEKCGLPQQAINRIEQGRRKVDIDLLIKLASALNVTTQELLSYDNMVGDITPSGDIAYVDSDLLEYRRIREKQVNGEGFTPYDKRFISDYIDKDPFIRGWFIENGLKSQEANLRKIQEAYECLNDEGRNEAAKRIAELTEIKRYTETKDWFQGSSSMTKEQINEALKSYLDNED